MTGMRHQTLAAGTFSAIAQADLPGTGVSAGHPGTF